MLQSPLVYYMDWCTHANIRVRTPCALLSVDARHTAMLMSWYSALSLQWHMYAEGYLYAKQSHSPVHWDIKLLA